MSLPSCAECHASSDDGEAHRDVDEVVGRRVHGVGGEGGEVAPATGRMPEGIELQTRQADVSRWAAKSLDYALSLPPKKK